jgi:hypothetical protein
VELTYPANRSEIVAERWPAMGLARAEEVREPVVKRLAVQPGELPGVLFTLIDDEPSPGGWHRIESELSLFAAERLAGRIAVHAAVLRHESRALLVPGASHVGKSTLCVAAAEAGLAVLTDEYALVDPSTGHVTGWPRPVRMRRDDGTLERLDLVVASPPVPVALLALVAYRPGAQHDWTPISGADAVLGIMDNTVCARSRPDESLDAALAIARRAPAVGGFRGDAARALPELLALMSAE